MAKRHLDETDRRLLALLEADARTPAALLARRIGLSRTAVQERIGRLVRDGEIAAFTIRRGRSATAALTAHVMLSVDPKQGEAVVRALRSMPEVRICQSVSGAYDLIAVLEESTTEAMDRLLDEIGRLPGVERTTSSIILSTKFRRDGI